MFRKNISLDDDHLRKLQPFLDKHSGNLSAAVREAIEIAHLALGKPGSPEEAVECLKCEDEQFGKMEKLVQSGECVLISRPVMSWLVKNTSGRLVDDDVIYELLNPYRITTIPDLGEYLNCRSKRRGWNIDISFVLGGEAGKDCANMSFVGGDRDLRELLVETVCLFLGRWMNLDLEAVHRKGNSTTIYLKSFVRHESLEIPPGILKYFGSMDGMYREIERKPDFWKTLVELYKFFNYQRVNIDRNLFEAFAAGEFPDIKKYFELKAGRELHEIPFSELAPLFKHLVLVSQLVSDVEISTEKGNEYIRILHNYSSEEVASKMAHLFSDVFRAGMHGFSVTSLKGLIIFEFNDFKAGEESPELSLPVAERTES